MIACVPVSSEDTLLPELFQKKRCLRLEWEDLK